MDKPKAICSPLFQSWGHKNRLARISYLSFELRPWSKYISAMFAWFNKPVSSSLCCVRSLLAINYKKRFIIEDILTLSIFHFAHEQF